VYLARLLVWRRGRVLASEIWQFLMLAVGFFVVALLWLFIVYLPGRTMERWEDKRTNRKE
jgi:hypothetical protein